ncbi:putative U3 small nucleolar RNA-associated protein 4 like protein [Blattamonas nauphoetae]|uniref:U3 small nucleolar RNA-associated protein 4 like protein n=1 Tax=Blattamonas nauphoetae TaxID=2049346 RepID=A0ABQ9XP31_9EUKA|nr:putative U3 small nucleolar RNA-associated protein 4 like protein [Blattamonas nauphoetae]
MKIHRNRLVDWIPSSIVSVAIDPTGNFTALARENSSIEIYSTANLSNIFLYCAIPPRESLQIRSLVWIPDLQHSSMSIKSQDTTKIPTYRLIAGTLTGHLIEWNLSRLSEQYMIDTHGGAVWNLALSPNGELLGVACEDGSVRLYSTGVSSDDSDDYTHLLDGSASKLSLRSVLPRQEQRVLVVSFSSNSNIVFQGGCDGVIRGTLIQPQSSFQSVVRLELDFHGKTPPSIWTLTNEKNGVICCGDSLGHVCIWDVVTGTLLHSFTRHHSDVLTMAFQEDGKTLFAAGADGRITQYSLISLPNTRQSKSGSMDIDSDMSEWRFVSIIKAHVHDIRSLALYEGSTDRHFIISGGVDTTMNIISLLPSGLETSTLPPRKTKKQAEAAKNIPFLRKKKAQLEKTLGFERRKMSNGKGNSEKVEALTNQVRRIGEQIAKNQELKQTRTTHMKCSIPAPSSPFHVSVSYAPPHKRKEAKRTIKDKDNIGHVLVQQPHTLDLYRLSRKTPNHELHVFRNPLAHPIISAALGPNCDMLAFSDELEVKLLALTDNTASHTTAQPGKACAPLNISPSEPLLPAHQMLFVEPHPTDGKDSATGDQQLVLMNTAGVIQTLNCSTGQVRQVELPRINPDAAAPLLRFEASSNGCLIAVMDGAHDIHIFSIHPSLSYCHTLPSPPNHATFLAFSFTPSSPALRLITSDHTVWEWDPNTQALTEWFPVNTTQFPMLSCALARINNHSILGMAFLVDKKKKTSPHDRFFIWGDGDILLVKPSAETEPSKGVHPVILVQRYRHILQATRLARGGMHLVELPPIKILQSLPDPIVPHEYNS